MATPIYSQIYRSAADKFHPEFPLFKEHVGNHLFRAEQVAKDILGPSAGTGAVAGVVAVPHTVTKIGKIKIGNTYKTMAFNSFNTTNVNTGRGRNNEDDAAARVLLFILGSVITGLALYKIGEWWQGGQEAEEELDDVHAFKGTIKHDIQLFPHNSHLKKLDEITKAEKRIFNRFKTNANRNLALTVAAAVAGTFLAMGALFATPEIIVAGAVIGFVTGGAALLKLGFSHYDKGPARDAKIIRSAVETLKKAKTAEQGLAHAPMPVAVTAAPFGVAGPSAAATHHVAGNGLIRPVHPGWSFLPAAAH